jgi:hypothetical protein
MEPSVEMKVFLYYPPDVPNVPKNFPDTSLLRKSDFFMPVQNRFFLEAVLRWHGT